MSQIDVKTLVDNSDVIVTLLQQQGVRNHRELLLYELDVLTKFCKADMRGWSRAQDRIAVILEELGI